MPTSFAKRILSIASNDKIYHRPIYWSVLNHETKESINFNTKLEALMYKNTLPHATIYFHWYEDQFANGSIIEPWESYEELRRQRAQEIRDTYDYVRLWYSGGSDSQTALNSFVKNNIHIDEIAVHMWEDYNVSDPYQSCSRELLISALPYLKQIKDKIPNTKITIVIPNKNDYLKYVSNADVLGELPFLHSMDNASFEFHMSTPQAAWEKVLDTTTIENYCDVYGGTKPTICVKDNQWYFYMVDSGLTDFYLSARAEDFFISRSNPKLFLKTAYMLHKYLAHLYTVEKEANYFHKKRENSVLYNAAIGRDPVNKIAIYKFDRSDGYQITDHNITVQGIKQTLFIKNMIKDNWWNELFKKYKENYRLLKEMYPYLWNTNSNFDIDPNKGYAGHTSLLYSLTTGKSYDNCQIFKNGFLE